jgi:hypothetical protein
MNDRFVERVERAIARGLEKRPLKAPSEETRMAAAEEIASNDKFLLPPNINDAPRQAIVHKRCASAAPGGNGRSNT